MDPLDPIHPQFWFIVGTAAVCGTIIGVERQLRGKPAGIRTSILVCLSSAVFIHLGATNIGGGDPTRVLGQLVSGVGFLGGGVMFARDGLVSGVTTAAVIWVLAAIGAAIGLGHGTDAMMLSVVVVVMLVGIQLLESGVRRLKRGAHASPSDPPKPVIHEP